MAAAVLLALAATLALYQYAGLADQGTPRANAGQIALDDPLSGRMRMLEERLSRTEEMLAASNRSQAHLPVPPTSPEQQELQLQQALADSRDAARKQQAHYVQQFSSAPPAGARQEAATKGLLQGTSDPALLAESSAPLSQDIQCRADLCRMEFVFAQRQDADEWALLYPAMTADQLVKINQYIEQPTDGSIRLVMYGEMKRN